MAPQGMNIDVVDAVAWTSSLLPHAIRGKSVRHAVHQIIQRLGDDKIHRLRFFGHGLSTGGIVVGGGKQPNIETQTITIQEKLLMGQEFLKLLTGRFRTNARVELHGCTDNEVAVVRVLKRLADLWDTRVLAAVGDQLAGGKDATDTFEGQVIEADGTRGGNNVSVVWK